MQATQKDLICQSKLQIDVTLVNRKKVKAAKGQTHMCSVQADQISSPDRDAAQRQILNSEYGNAKEMNFDGFEAA